MSAEAKHPNVTAIIINWNSGEQLRHCLASLQGQCHAIVVDNGSTDNSCDGIQNFPGVTLIQARENLGFGKACNLGARGLDVDYLLFLNPDAAVFPDTLEKALYAMQSPEYADVGICGVQLIDTSGQVSRSCARFPNAGTLLGETIGLHRLSPKRALLMSDWAHDTTMQVDHVIGAFYLIRKRVFDELNGFDENFFLYLEDLDLSYRAKLAGWNSLYLADAQAFHKGGGASDQVKAKRLFYVLRSRVLYAFKHFTRTSAVVVLLATIIAEPLSRSTLALARRSWEDLKNTWQGYGMFLRWLPAWIFKGSTR